MTSSIEHNAHGVQATKNKGADRRRRKSLLDDHAALDRDERNFWALEWSLYEVTHKVLIAQGHQSVSREHFRELHARLFPGGWPALRNLHDGWRARAFRPLTYTDLNPAGMPIHDEDGQVTVIETPAGGLPRTLQLGALLGWEWPIHKPSDGSREDSSATVALAEGFRRRCEGSKGNPAQMWHNRQTRNARAVRELEGRINAEGVRVEWAEEPMTEPRFRPYDSLSASTSPVPLGSHTCSPSPR